MHPPVKSIVILPLAIAAAAGSASGQAKSPAKTDNVRYVVAPAGNEARYRVREQLAGFDLPKDAIGATKNVTGRVFASAPSSVYAT